MSNGVPDRTDGILTVIDLRPDICGESLILGNIGRFLLLSFWADFNSFFIDLLLIW